MLIVNAEEMKKLQEGLAELPKAIPIVTTRAINYAAGKMRTETWKNIKNEYNIDQSRVYDALTIVKANYSNLSGALVATAPHLKLGYFKVTPPDPHPAPQRPVITVAVKKGGGVEMPGAFVATMKSGHTGVFVRVEGEQMKDKKKQKIRELFTIGVSEMLEADRVKEKVETAGRDALFYEFGRQADLAMEKALDHK